MAMADRAGPVNATAANPSPNDDSNGTAGNGKFYVWSKWVNTATNAIFICVDATPQAAVWINVTAGGGGGGLPPGYINRLLLGYVSASTAEISAGNCRDSANGFDITLASAATVDITISGAGGLDTGSEAPNTWYAVFVIADSTNTNPPVGLLSTNATSPTMPAGYDVFRRVGWIRNNSSSDFYKWYQTGSGELRIMRWNESMVSPPTLQVLSGGAAQTLTDVNVSQFVPPTSERSTLHLENESKREGYVRPKNGAQNFARLNADADIIYDVPAPGQLIEYRYNSGGGPAGFLNISVLGYYDQL
ncbi:MAG: hypothetical protein GC159_17775 [Phycisphaera sp.]|nr:hypothetical protein [Phycisphaera sp.]